jgi:hypothetical protein
MGRKAVGRVNTLCMIVAAALLSAAPIGAGFGRAAESGNAAAQALESLPRDAQDRIKAEANDVQQKCMEDTTYRSYHDCQCLRGKFVEARLADQHKNRLNITFDLRAECVNKPGITSYNYDFCFTHASHMMPATKNIDDAQRADYCKCFANGMAQSYSAAPDPRYSYISNMQIKVLNTCLPK